MTTTPATESPPGEAGPDQPPESSATQRALSEATLVTRAQDGDANAFAQLVRAYEAEMVRLGFRVLSDFGEAQDAAQDAFVTAWRKLPTLDDPQAFRPWMYQLMTRRCLNLVRSRQRRRTSLGSHDDLSTDLEETASTRLGTDPAEEAARRELREGLVAALATLPTDLRTCWVLASLHELSYPEIAYAMDIPVSTVRGRIARARARLVKEMSTWQ